MPAAVAAVVLVLSEASIDSLLVDITVVPLSLMSMMIVDPVGCVLTAARTAVRVAANGIRNRALLVPVVIAVVSSEHLMQISNGMPTHVGYAPDPPARRIWPAVPGPKSAFHVPVAVVPDRMME